MGFRKRLHWNHYRVLVATNAALLIPVFSQKEPKTLGIVLLALGVLLRCWSLGNMEKKKAVLAMKGPYAFSRNPLYIANILLAAGVGAAMGYAWVAVLFPLLAFLVFRYRVQREEAHLRVIHGAAYDAYCARVARWLPMRIPHPCPSWSFDWKSFSRNHGFSNLAGFAAFMLWWDVLGDLIMPWLQEGKPIAFLLGRYFRHFI
ncbi:MAG: isoprenylcysteine carboxylmethyltransferase family protein [bacterium]|nr:isoprenylcysteine carboxylmethyltransferase family protein [bacterium]